ncbi:MAG: IS3 family transposase [Thermoanaerobacteraceae bacterium]|nr:IS3 family transposase [Thermoanaerobacteraceae bacterium]
MLLELEYPITLLCEIAGVSRSAYYKYKKKPLKKTDGIENLIVEIFNRSNRRAGYRTIKYTLRYKYGIIVNHKKIQRIMREKGLGSIVRKKSKRAKEQSIVKENLLARDFTATEPGKKFVVDITYIPTQYRMFYLCTIIDLYNREPVAWKVSDTANKQLSIDTIKQLSKRFNLAGSIIHSDQGIQFTNKDYVALLEKLKVQQSMSRKGNCWDNALAESFFSHYKCEAIYLMKNKIKNYEDVLEITEEYMYYYINERPQKKLGGLPPKVYKKLKLAA